MTTITQLETTKINGQNVSKYLMNIENSVRIQVCEFGATITHLWVPDKFGKYDDVVLGFNEVEEYDTPQNPYLGGTLGRVANRMKGGQFIMPGDTAGGKQTEGVMFRASKNDGNNTLNGGMKGFNRRIWRSEIEDSNTVKMWYDSIDGEEGFPGNAHVEVRFSLIKNGHNTAHLVIRYSCQPQNKTRLSVATNPFFNLAGHASGKDGLYRQRFQVSCDEYLELDKELLPTGMIKNVRDTPLDLRNFMTFGDAIGKSGGQGFDTVYAIENASNDVHLRNVAYVLDDASGRYMEVSTDHPAMHFSTLNTNKEIRGKATGVTYNFHSGVCFTPQMFPDAGNHNSFPSNLFSKSRPYEYMNCYMFGIIYH